jgi:RNA polymerase sigma-70 factor (ECF subfamily)
MAEGLRVLALSLVGSVSRSQAVGMSEAATDRECDLVAACRRGEAQAFERLVERHQRAVFGLCLRMVNHREDAADLTQEVFVRAFRSIGRFRGESAVSTWLYRIAVNACRTFRSTRRPDGQPLQEDSAVAAPALIEGLDREARARLVREAIARLPEKQRATLVLKVYHEMTHEQVAEVLGTTAGTAKANLFHALVKLRRLLAGRGLEPGGIP